MRQQMNKNCLNHRFPWKIYNFSMYSEFFFSQKIRFVIEKNKSRFQDPENVQFFKTGAELNCQELGT